MLSFVTRPMKPAHWIDMHCFERALEFPRIEFELSARDAFPRYDHWLNPRRLRGSDFLMRWSQGRWSEDRIVQAINETGSHFALPYGPSGVAPQGDVRAFELYFEELERAGIGHEKRPDLLIFCTSSRPVVDKLVAKAGGAQRLPFLSETEPPMRKLLTEAILAIECENSLWVTKSMPDYGKELRPQRRLDGKHGLRKGAVLPTIILKDEDRHPLNLWGAPTRPPIHIWHAFYDQAYGIALDRFEELIGSGLIEPTKQVFQAPGGATTTKVIYKCYYHYAYEVGACSEPQLQADSIVDKNGHILPYVRFHGGNLSLSEHVRNLLSSLSRTKNGSQ